MVNRQAKFVLRRARAYHSERIGRDDFAQLQILDGALLKLGVRIAEVVVGLEDLVDARLDLCKQEACGNRVKHSHVSSNIYCCVQTRLFSTIDYGATMPLEDRYTKLL